MLWGYFPSLSLQAPGQASPELVGGSAGPLFVHTVELGALNSFLKLPSSLRPEAGISVGLELAITTLGWQSAFLLNFQDY